MQFGTLTELLDALGNVALALVALTGISTWRKQLKGSTEHQVAVLVMRRVYELEGVLRWARNPLTQRDDERLEGTGRDKVARNIEHRLARVEESVASLKVAMVEGRVLWEDSFENAVAPLLECIRDLRVASWMFSANQNTDEASKTLIGSWGDKDAFGKELLKCIESVASFMRTKIHLSTAR